MCAVVASAFPVTLQLLIDGWYGIPSRNVRNNVRLIRDGPAKGWEELSK